MRTAEARNTIEELKTARRSGITSEILPIGKYDQIHMMLSESQKEAEKFAFNSLDSSMRSAIEHRIMMKKLYNQDAELGIIPTNRY
jgi:hypothetical protein